MSPFKLLLVLALVMACGRAPAQSEREPVLYVKAQEGGQSGSMSWQTTGAAEYRLCTHWDGSRHGMAAKELFRLRRSVLGLKPGERLQFYRVSESGEGTGRDGDSAYQVTTTCQGEGRYLTTFREPNRTSTRQEPEGFPGTIPLSAFAEAELIRTAKGARLVLSGIPGPHCGDGPFAALGLDNLSISEEEKARLYTVDLTEADLAGWDQLTKTIGGRFQAKAEFQGSWSFAATLTTTLPDLGEVDVEVAGYDNWLPLGNLEDEGRPGNTVKVTARVRATGEVGRKVDTEAEFTFELTDVSQEPGVCLNWPTKSAPGGLDLKLRKVENDGLKVVTENRKLASKGFVKEASLVVSAFDYAAWGVLQVTAKDKDGKALKVTYHKKEQTGLTLPKDEDRNRIADAWQIEKGVEGLPADWDGADVPGQETKGDGFGLYQKYRGVVVVTPGGRAYQRLEPREKAHFFIDPQNVIDLDQWLTSTGIHAFRVDESWTQSRRVDRYVGYGAGVGKWASRFSKDETEVYDPASDSEQAVARQQWAFTKGQENVARWTPRQVESCVVFPGRVRFVMRELKEHMRVSLRNPTTPNELNTAAFLLALGFPREALLKRIEALGEHDFQARTDQVMKWAALHEACHACGLKGHLNSEGEEAFDSPNRVPDCPMQYPTKVEKLRLLLFGEMGGLGRCCSKAPHNCFKGLSPKG